MTSYYDKLKDPRWQKKRLMIMNRDNFTCLKCGNTRNTLNVHHKTYRKDLDPWEYSDEDLKTLCQHCHEDSYMEVFYEMASEIVFQPYTKNLSLALDRLIEKYNA